MSISKPILLLDVDGVLNVPVNKAKGSALRTAVSLEDAPTFYPVKNTRKIMEWAWENFEVYWLTAWFQMANKIADWVGLPSKPALDDRSPGLSGDYKLRAVKRLFSNHDGKVVWIEDGIGKEAEEWVATKPNFRYIYTNSYQGLKFEHVQEACEFAGVKWKGKAWK